MDKRGWERLFQASLGLSFKTKGNMKEKEYNCLYFQKSYHAVTAIDLAITFIKGKNITRVFEKRILSCCKRTTF